MKYAAGNYEPPTLAAHNPGPHLPCGITVISNHLFLRNCWLSLSWEVCLAFKNAEHFSGEHQVSAG
jgi:hypothetical protein